MNKLKKYLNTKDFFYIKNILLGLLTGVGIILYGSNITSINYNIFTYVFIGFIIYFYIKTDNQINKRDKKYAIILGIIITLFLVVGNIVNNNILDNKIFTIKHILLVIIEFVCLLPFINRLFILLLTKTSNIKINLKNIKISKKTFFIIWLVLILLYLPYYIRYFPGKMSYDSYYYLDIIKSGTLSNWHPFFYIKLVGLLYNFGSFIFKSERLIIGFIIFIQIIVYSLIIASLIYFLLKRNINKKYCYLLVGIYGILPQFTHMAVTLWKDVPFSLAFVLLFMALFSFKYDNKSINFKNKYLYIFILAILMIIFFRNNGIYILLFMTPFILYTFRKYLKIFLPLLIIIISLYYVIEIPIFKHYKVINAPITESLSIPLQQMARVYKTKEQDDKYLNKLFGDVNTLEYVPYLSDTVKGTANASLVKDDFGKFLKNWLRLLFKHPITYIEAYLSQTTGYWFTDVNYWVTCASEESQNLLPDYIQTVFDATASKKIPYAEIVWSTGIAILTFLISYVMCLYKRIKCKIIYVPFLGLWITNMIASPVYAEFRYVYAFSLLLPIIILLPFINNNVKLKNN